MTLKHQLLNDLFKTDTAPDLNIKDPEKLSTILTSLQTMSDIFNDMELNEVCRAYTNSIQDHVQGTIQSLGDLDKWYRNPDLQPNMKDC